ncbi:hypothetical protein M501DRAFT_869885 [Patellaria atrata CBS 101060]|uniref:Uncharacterized protein n=1 Tax=Patellaria atrata CBS 101060 TaxID=1346257 RepID=A0A9P4S906_9PEZI|nr:hypothetical protein M501DRAFT_869885 [Patellaria atrata CBS 101060]
MYHSLVQISSLPSKMYFFSFVEISVIRLASFILSMVEDKSERNVKNLPSWVPDLTCKRVPGDKANVKKGFDVSPIWRKEHRGCSITDNIWIAQGIQFVTVADVIEPDSDECWALTLLYFC